MMPVREGRVYSFGELNKTTFKGLPGMLFFEKRLALTGRTSGNAIETLCYLGKRCMVPQKMIEEIHPNRVFF